MEIPSLEDFVATTLEQVVAGVVRAQESGSKLGAKVGAAGITGQEYREVEFDISVSATQDAGSGARLKVGVASVLQGSVGGSSDAARAAAHRVRFTILVVFPRAPTVAG